MNKCLRAVPANFIFLVVSVMFFLIITPTAIRAWEKNFMGYERH
jgi:hypothetical protein